MRNRTIVFFGENSPGCTSLTQSLTNRPLDIDPDPTLTFDIINFEKDGFKLQFFDLTSNLARRQLLLELILKKEPLIAYCVDLSKLNNIKDIESIKASAAALENQTHNTPLIIGTKFDIASAEQINLINNLQADYKIVTTSAFTKKGLDELISLFIPSLAIRIRNKDKFIPPYLYNLLEALSIELKKLSFNAQIALTPIIENFYQQYLNDFDQKHIVNLIKNCKEILYRREIHYQRIAINLTKVAAATAIAACLFSIPLLATQIMPDLLFVINNKFMQIIFTIFGVCAGMAFFKKTGFEVILNQIDKNNQLASLDHSSDEFWQNYYSIQN